MQFDDDALEAHSPLNQELATAASNPESFDSAFLAQREATGFANFGFDPATAAAMRLEEQQRIEQEQ
jgi:hypothetical protein